MAGYEVTFKDFCQLVSKKPYREVIGAFLNEWYGYEIVGYGEATVIRSASENPVSLELLHQKVQRDAAKQYKLYQAAMSFWC